jgi:hypothetical protein
MAEPDRDPIDTDGTVSRRRALARLGIASVAAYAAPSVLRINRNVNADLMLSTPCPQQDNNPANNPPTCPP